MRASCDNLASIARQVCEEFGSDLDVMLWSHLERSPAEFVELNI